jgi:hypothetical protein
LYVSRFALRESHNDSIRETPDALLGTETKRYIAVVGRQAEYK